jgi:hypothetical protein
MNHGHDMRRARRRQHATENKEERPKSWRKAEVVRTGVETGRFRVTLDADVEMTSVPFLEFEKHLAELDIEVLEKHSNRFTRLLIVRGASDSIRHLKFTHDHIVDIIAPAPIAKLRQDSPPPVLLAGPSETPCSPEVAKRQMAVEDTLGQSLPTDRTNLGQGAIMVVWDTAFDASSAEFTQRPGGTPIQANENAEPGAHGGYAASIACGATAGLAPGARLFTVGLTNNIDVELALIDSLIIQPERKRPARDQRAVIVNMSFAMTYSPDLWEQHAEDIVEACSMWDDILDQLQEDYPRLVFVNAGGNDAEDVCDQTFGGFSTTCGTRPCYVWPSFAHGDRTYGVDKEAIVRVGAVHATAATLPAPRALAPYTNTGNCIPLYAHGHICAYNWEKRGWFTTMGTSFAAPVLAASLALVMTKYPNLSGKQAVKHLVATGDRISTAGGATGTFARVAPEVLIGDFETPVDPGPQPKTVEEGVENLAPPPSTRSARLRTALIALSALAALVLAIFIIATLARSKK